MSNGTEGIEAGVHAEATVSPPTALPAMNNETGKANSDLNTQTGSERRSGSSPPPQSQMASLPSVFEHRSANYYPYYHASPTPPTPNITGGGSAGHDTQTLLSQQQAPGNPFARQLYSQGIPPPPLSPNQQNNSNKVGASGNISMGIVPPASPLFHGAQANYDVSTFNQTDSLGMSRTSAGSMVAPPSPQLSYMTAHAVPLSPGSVSGYGVYQGYAGANSVYENLHTRDVTAPSSPEQLSGWADRNTLLPHIYQMSPVPSPHLHSQSYFLQYPTNNTGRNRRTTSFDELLPLDDQGQYVGNSGGGGTILAHQQPWGYTATTDPYSTSIASQIGIHRQGLDHLGRHGPASPIVAQPYYAATTPGPPIQTTPHNKGPDGANLFIFHIPNHFTNLDMYHLFCHYGNLLSVRIMVEKDTGRSRGFGFVSYDSPGAAAMAIKELNGFVIGNKRLKVQHKQIRASDHGIQQNEHQALPLFPTGSRGYMTSNDSSSGFPIDQNSEMKHSGWSGGQEGVSDRVRPDNRSVTAGAGNSTPYHNVTTDDSKATGNAIAADTSQGSYPKAVPEAGSSGSNGAFQRGSPLGNLDQIRDALP